MKSETRFVDWILRNARQKNVNGVKMWGYCGGLFTPDELKQIYETVVEPKLN